MPRPIGWVRPRAGRVLLACIVVVLVGLGCASAAQARSATPAPTAVRDVQKRLAELKFLPLSEVDGKLGPRTRDAITAFQQWNGLSADGIAGPQTLSKLRTAAAPRHGTHGPPRRIEIYRAKGVTLLVDNGRVKRAIHSSAGKRGYETPTGSYRIQRKMLKDWSRPYKTWMPYASYFHAGYALHEGAVPAYPASHGCVRLPSWDAADVYRFATVGTTVVVY
ncbi:MAG TPA: L,D-transpeptidase family protein [Solirubrobacteraceae bacterium]|nr:L,D-transpeptidase family protein [Solirubrobacteraceae bacterium]